MSVDPAEPRRYVAIRQDRDVHCWRPRVFRDGGAGGRREVQAPWCPVADVEGCDDAVGLGVALETVGETEVFACKAVEDRLPQMTERRMTQIMGGCSGLGHDGVADIFLWKRARLGKRLLHVDGD